MSPRNPLPPLPSKYRKTVSSDLGQDVHGFRPAAFLLSLAFLVVGVGVGLTAVSGGDVVGIIVSAGAILVFVANALASRFWSDQPVEGPRRFLAELQFIVLACLAASGLIYLLGALALFIGRVVLNEPALLVILIALGALIVYLSRRWHVADLIGTRISGGHLAEVARGMHGGDGRTGIR